jgi:aspartyl-tRNA(Asn)/glutamyl-tRNA(Gln) amidotransferase subunit C
LIEDCGLWIADWESGVSIRNPQSTIRNRKGVMAGMISEETVRHIALLSRLECTDEEIRAFAADLNEILEYAEKLKELDTTGIEPTTHALRQKNVFREDVTRPSLTNQQALANAPESEAGHFKVPQIIQEL